MWQRLLEKIGAASFPVRFLIAGVQKGGTTALDSFLRQHHALCMAKRKECHFFDDDAYFPAGQQARITSYHAMFPGGWRGLRGETTPSYLYCPEAAPRIAAYNPGMKIVILLRDPVERAFSHWHMETTRGFENLPFEEAIAVEPERLASQPGNPVYSYLDRGLYARQLNRLWRHIPREQSLVLRSEQLRGQPVETVAEVCRFLGVEPLPGSRISKEPVFAQQYRSEMPPACRCQLQAHFEPDIRELESLLGWDCHTWLEA